MKFPLFLRFKLLALSPQIFVDDSEGNTVCYVKQKLLKLKEAITVYRDVSQTEELYKIGADRIIDFNAKYNISRANGDVIGTIQRRGMRSLFKAQYELTRGDQSFGQMKEENAWIKFLDGLIEGIPVVGMFTGYFLHPSYVITDAASAPVIRVKKQSAFFEGKYKIEQLTVMSDEEVEYYTMCVMMMLLLERSRG